VSTTQRPAARSRAASAAASANAREQVGERQILERRDDEVGVREVEHAGHVVGKADEAIAVEDSPNGITAARAAGIFTVAVPNDVTRALDLSHADLVLDSFGDLPLADLLARVG